MLNRCWLIDGSEIFNSAHLSQEEFVAKQQEAKELSAGNMCCLMSTCTRKVYNPSSFLTPFQMSICN
jgi:hypothetical protein